MKIITNRIIVIGKKEIAKAFKLDLDKLGYGSYSNLQHSLTFEIKDN